MFLCFDPKLIDPGVCIGTSPSFPQQNKNLSLPTVRMPNNEMTGLKYGAKTAEYQDHPFIHHAESLVYEVSSLYPNRLVECFRLANTAKKLCFINHRQKDLLVTRL